MEYTSKQFAWSHLIRYGSANVRPSYYGGTDPVDDSLPFEEKDWYRSFNTGCLKLIDTHGIDWKKTAAPKSNSVPQFTDTFHDPSEVEMLTGVITLRNGQSIYYCGDIPMTSVFDMMADYEESISWMDEHFRD